LPPEAPPCLNANAQPSFKVIDMQDAFNQHPPKPTGSKSKQSNVNSSKNRKSSTGKSANNTSEKPKSSCQAEFDLLNKD